MNLTIYDVAHLPERKLNVIKHYALLLGLFHMGLATAEDLQLAEDILQIEVPELIGEYQ